MQFFVWCGSQDLVWDGGRVPVCLSQHTPDKSYRYTTVKAEMFPMVPRHMESQTICKVIYLFTHISEIVYFCGDIIEFMPYLDVTAYGGIGDIIGNY